MALKKSFHKEFTEPAILKSSDPHLKFNLLLYDSYDD